MNVFRVFHRVFGCSGRAGHNRPRPTKATLTSGCAGVIRHKKSRSFAAITGRKKGAKTKKRAKTLALQENEREVIEGQKEKREKRFMRREIEKRACT